MNLRKNPYNYIKLFVFCIYNITYVLYMVGYMSRYVNLMLLAVFIGMCIYQFIYSNKKIGEKKYIFLSEFKRAMVIVLSFLFISITIQIIHNDIQFYVVSELLYNMIPPVLAFFWINTTEDEERKKYFYIFFFKSLMYFVLSNLDNFSIENIKKIDWNDSNSSLFESPLAHDFLFLEIIFLQLKNKKLAIASFLLCLLSFKRISFILAGVILIMSLKKSSKKSDMLAKMVSKKIIILVFVIMIVSPFIIKWISSSSGIEFFYEQGIDINEFSTGRIGLIQYVQNNIKYYNGYGSIDYFMENSQSIFIAELGNMHCDILKLYFEVTELGVIIFVYEMLQIAKRNKIVFFMLMYLFLEIISSHFIDVLSVWNIYFMFVAYKYAQNEKVK